MKHSVSFSGLMILALILLVASVMAASEPSTISPALKTSDSAASYDDNAFQEKAGYAINNLTQPIPTGNSLMELKSIYYEIVKKNISPDYYSDANNITNYIFYVLKAAENIQNYNEHSSSNKVNPDFYSETYDQAKIDLAEAKQIWTNISALYPNASVVSNN